MKLIILGYEVLRNIPPANGGKANGFFLRTMKGKNGITCGQFSGAYVLTKLIYNS
jgi:hypothetical protein